MENIIFKLARSKSIPSRQFITNVLVLSTILHAPAMVNQ
jgi:hypothetical protein